MLPTTSRRCETMPLTFEQLLILDRLGRGLAGAASSKGAGHRPNRVGVGPERVSSDEGCLVRLTRGPCKPRGCDRRKNPGASPLRLIHVQFTERRCIAG